ncbi:MAG: MlaD family protein [Rikenellaceae bacterium]
MKKEVKIGIFTILMIVAAWGGIRFLSGMDLFSSNEEYFARYDQIDGVQSSSPIFIKGVKVGTVTEITLDPTYDADVVLRLSIKGDFKIPSNSEAKIYNSSIMGPMAIELKLGDSKEYLSPGDTINSSRDKGIFDTAETELEFLKERIEKVTSELTTTLENLNSLLEGNSESISGTLRNLDALSANLNLLVSKNQENLTTMVDGFSKVSQTLGESTPQIDSIIRNINVLTADLGEAQLGSTLSESLNQLNEVMAQLNNSEGSIGKILNDDELYLNLASVSANLDALLYDFKENPARYINVSVFGRSALKQEIKAEKRMIKDAVEAEKDAVNSARKASK